jgi:HemY protein
VFLLLLAAAAILAVLAAVGLRFGWFWQRSLNKLGGHHWRSARRKSVAGILAYAEGNWAEAEKLMLKAARHSDTKLINFLIAAEAAQQQGASDRRDEYLRMAKDVAPDADIAIGLTQARAQLQGGQLEQAHATLSHLYAMAPGNPYLLGLYAEVLCRLQEWDTLLDVVRRLEKLKFQHPRLPLYRQKAVAGMLDACAAQKDPSALEQFWKSQPRSFRKDPAQQLTYAAALMRSGAQDKAAVVLRKLLSGQSEVPRGAWRLYAAVKHPDCLKALTFLEEALATEPDNREILLACAHLAFEAKLWGKARDYLNAAANLGRDLEVLLKLIRVERQLGHDQAALRILETLEDGLLDDQKLDLTLTRNCVPAISPSDPVGKATST